MAALIVYIKHQCDLRHKVIGYLFMNKNLTLAKRIVAGTAVVAALTLSSAPAFGSGTYSTPEQPRAKIMIDKSVFNPSSNSYVDNLSVTQHNFLPGQEVKFKLVIKNTGDKDLWSIDVSDKFPKEVEFVSGTGNYDKNSHTLTFKVDGLKPNESTDREIRVKIKNAADIHSNMQCPTNFAEAKVENMIDQDTAQFCVSKQVLGETKELPKTGVGAFGMLISSTVIFAGAALALARKKQTV
jgi:uncharacterized repeat protein (TIGR01451 family)